MSVRCCSFDSADTAFSAAACRCRHHFYAPYAPLMPLRAPAPAMRMPAARVQRAAARIIFIIIFRHASHCRHFSLFRYFFIR
jgi:hypothetical protein